MKRRWIILLLAALVCVAACAGADDGPDPQRLEEFQQELARLEAQAGASIQYWTVEERYAFCARYDDVTHFPGYEGPRHSIPRDGEVTQAAARAAAVAAIEAKHGEAALSPDLAWVEMVFFQEDSGGTRTWSFIFAHPVEGEPDNPAYVFEVALDAVRGEVVYLADATTGWG